MADIEQLHRVEYIVRYADGMQGKITQNLTQAALGKLLLIEGITLLNVNREAPAYIPRKKRK